MANGGSIDQLEIEISASSEAAAKHIKSLSDSLRELRKSLPTNTNTNKIKAFTDSIKGIDNEAANKLNRFSKALERLSTLSKVRIQKDLGDNLRNIALSVLDIPDDAIGRLDSMTRSLQRLANVDLRGVSSAMRSVGRTNVSNVPQSSGKEQATGGIADRVDTSSQESLSSIIQSIMQANSLWKTFATKGQSALNTVSDKSKEAASTIYNSISGAIGKLTKTGFIRSSTGFAMEFARDFSDAFRGVGEIAADHLKPITDTAKYIGATLAQPIISGAQKISTAFSKLGESGLNPFKKLFSGVEALANNIGSKLTPKIEQAKNKLYQLAKSSLLPFRNIIRSVGSAKKSISEFASSFGRIAMYRAIRKILSEISQGIREGSDNLYQYSRLIGTDFHKSLDGIAADALYIKNSLATVAAPIINFLKPAFDALSDSIAHALDRLAQLMAMLTGATVYSRAVKSVTQYGEAVAAANEKVKQFTIGIDELNVISDSAGGAGSATKDFGSMFEEVAVPKNIESPFKDIFDVFKQAWESEGVATINAIKESWESVKALLGVVGDSFREVFTNGTGQQTLETYLQIVQNIAGIIGGLADSFRKAWEENERGTAIVQTIWDIYNDILKTWKDITEAIKEWAQNLDFGPALESVKNFLDALKPLVDLITDGLAWAWENILLPVGKWVIEKALPESIDAVRSVIDLFTEALKQLQPFADWFWEKILKPLGEWAGKVFIEALEDITSDIDALTSLLRGDTSFKEFLDNLVFGESKAKTFGDAIAFLANPFKILLAYNGAVIKAGKKLYENWDVVKEKMKSIIDSIVGFFKNMGTTITKTIGNIKDALGNLFNVEGIGSAISGAISVVKSKIPLFATGGFPETGQLFMAREAGPELVGQIGNRTTVANNEQIVSGIAQGVASANETQNELLRQQNELLAAILAKTGFSIDGKTILSSVERAQRQRGANIMAGGVMA